MAVSEHALEIILERRQFVLGATAIASMWVPGVSLANKAASAASDGKEIRPYREVGPFPEDDGGVGIFFDFACGHCRNYHSMMTGWAATLPHKYLRARFVPVVANKDDIVAAAAFYAYEQKVKGNPVAMADFLSRGYTEVQENRQSKGDGRMWRRLANGPMSAGEEVRRRVVAAGDALVKYKITHTPALAISGRYVITPDDAGGSPQMFLQLMNGVASMVLAEKGYRP